MKTVYLISLVSRAIHKQWMIIGLAIKKFFFIDGVQCAGAFAFDAFFSLFPLIVLLVTIASNFVDRDRATTDVITYIENYVPISGETQQYIFGTITGVIEARKQAGVLALLILIWTSSLCFTTLIRATNRAWGTEAYNWWRLPLKGLLLLGIVVCAVIIGMAASVFTKMARDLLFPVGEVSSWAYVIGIYFISLLVVFFSLCLFYGLAHHRATRFTEVWAGALSATVLLQMAESLFIIYLKKFATFNVVYGAFGGIMALQLWIYLSGCILIFGACLCAAQTEVQL